MNNNNNPQIETITCKAILLGESGIGKTCIIRRLCTDSYDSNSIATVGSSCSVKVIEYPTHQRIKFEVWDTAGQESYRYLNKIFYRDAKIVILVYDITNRKSFDELQHYWARQLDSTCLNCSIIGIAANKSDLFNKEQISEEEGVEFANSLDAVFKLTSAFQGSGINELFQKLGEKLLNINQEPVVNQSITLDEDQIKKKKEKPSCCK